MSWIQYFIILWINNKTSDYEKPSCQQHLRGNYSPVIVITVIVITVIVITVIVITVIVIIFDLNWEFKRTSLFNLILPVCGGQ